MTMNTTTAVSTPRDLVNAAGLLRLAVLSDAGWMQPKVGLDGKGRSARATSVGAEYVTPLAALDHMERADLAHAWVHRGARRLLPSPATLADVKRAGWEFTVGHKSAAQDEGVWVSAYRPGVYGVRELHYPELDHNSAFHGDGDAMAEPLPMLRALTLYTLATGAWWSRSPGSTGQRLMRASMKRHTYSVDSSHLPEAVRDWRRHRDGALVWKRDLSERERGARYLVSFDRNAAWLAAAGMATLGVGSPVHLMGPYSAPAKHLKAGMFHVTTYGGPAFDRAHNLPDPLPNFPATGGWVAKPTLDLLDELEVPYTVDEAYAHAVGHRALETWYTRLSAARTVLLGEGLGLNLLKQVYTQGLGWLAKSPTDGWTREDDALYRPDWYATIKALSRANMLRFALKVARRGASPIACDTDCWYYLTDDVDWLTSLYPLGASLAEWKRTVYDLSEHPHLRALLETSSLSALEAALNRLDAEGEAA